MPSAAPLLQKPKDEAERPAPVMAAERTQTPISRSVDPARSTLLSPATLQAKGISSPDDAAEREADRVAAHVVSMPDPSPKAASRAPTSVMRSPLIVQRRPAPSRRAPKQAAPGGNVMQQVKAAASGGFALSKKTRAYLEPRFKADFSNVRLHTDGKAKELSNKVGARAFTFGRHIFFNEGQYDPESKSGLELLAHELTHTIQQREAIQRKAMVHERTDPHVQRIGNPFAAIADAVGDFVGDILQIVKDFAAEHADILPGFKILCLVLGYNPINDAPAPGGGRAILKELTTFIPFGDKVFEALNNHGIIDKGGAFIDTQIANFKSLASAIIGAISSFFGSLGPSDALNPLGAWNRLKSSFAPVFVSMKTFASGLINGFIDLVREVILPPMARWAAANIPHWDLLMGVLGVNPVSNGGESPTMQLIGAFMKLIGQEEVWENIKKGNAIGRAWAWFQTAMSGAKAMVSGIPGEVMATIRSFTIMDVLTVVGAAGKILGLFASIGGKFISWAGGTVIELLKIVIDVVAPGVMVYIQRAAGAFQTIVRNPIAFVGNLVRAAMQGFRQFAANFLTHLQASLVGWLTGAMGGAGVYIPQGLNLREILKFVLSVLGLTWANIRQKLVRATNEPTVVAMETGFDIVRTLVTEGPAAAWQKILETLTNLKEMAIDAIMDFVKQRVVQAAVTRLLSMLTPAGAFIQAVIAIYNTIMFFVERLQQIAQVAASFIDAIATIASGNIAPAANRVESTMAGLLTLVISFLARIAGLGRVADAITGLIARVRAPISTAIDRVVAWIVAQARRLGRAVMGAVRGADTRTPEEKQRDLDRAVRELRPIVRQLFRNGPPGPLLRARILVWKVQYRLNTLIVEPGGGIRATINPTALIDQLVPLPSQQALAIILEEVRRYFSRDRDPALTSQIRSTGAGTRTSPLNVTGASSPTQAVRNLLITGSARGETTLTVGTHRGQPVSTIIQRANNPTSPNSGEAFILSPTTGSRVTIGAYPRSREVPGFVTVAPAASGPNAATVLSAPFGGNSSLTGGYHGEFAREGRISVSRSMEAAVAMGASTTLAAQETIRNPLAAVTTPSLMERTATRGDQPFTDLSTTLGGPQAPRGSARDFRLVDHALSRINTTTGELGSRAAVPDPPTAGTRNAAVAGSEVRAAGQMNATVDALSNTILQGMVVDGVVMITGPSDFEIIRIRTRAFLRDNHGPVR